jgi:hypothetical protein
MLSDKSTLSVITSADNFFDICSQLDMSICLVWFMMFNATFNNISVISWRSVLLVEETGIPEENHQPIVRHKYKANIPHFLYS